MHREAVRLLNQRLSERGRVTSRRDLEKVSFADLSDLVLSDYTKNGRRSIVRLRNSLDHLRDHFGGWRAVDIREDAIDRYIIERQATGAANATINLELAALRRMFRLADRARLARDIPVFELLEENNVRKGFFEEPTYAGLRDSLPEHIRPLTDAGFITGWRKSELLSRRWRHVDFVEGWLRLEPGETKSGKGRMFPLIPQLRSVLQAQHTRKRAIEGLTGTVVTALFFHSDGRPTGEFRGPWRKACLATGLWQWAKDQEGNPILDRSGKPKKNLTHVFHDFRRTAARNLVRAGIPTALAKQFTGHETDSVFQRYAIADETSLREAGEKYAEQLGGMDAKPARGVVEIS